MKAIPARLVYASNPQNAVGSPSSVAQRLDSTMSQPPPAAHPCTGPPANAAQDKYVVRAMPRLPIASSGQLGAVRSACAGDPLLVSRWPFGLRLIRAPVGEDVFVVVARARIAETRGPLS